MLPHWEHGNGYGRLLMIDFGQSDWDINQCWKCWQRLCQFVERLKWIWISNYVPSILFPGYYETCKIVPYLVWNDPAIGTTPQSSHRWDNPLQSPYYQSNTYYVEHLTYDPEYVVALIIHEYFHAVMPLGLNMHNDKVGNIFTSPMQGEEITDFGVKAIGDACYALTSGYRVMLGTLVTIPHLVSADNKVQPGKFPGNGPRNSGNIQHAITGKDFDYSASINMKFK